jgi:MFS family permease
MKSNSETTNWYGIRVVFCVMCMLVAMAGFGMFCFGVVFKPLIVAFNWDRGAVAIANSVYLLAGGIGGIIANRLLKKYRIKTVMIIGAVSGAISYFFLSYTTSLLQLYVL